MITGKQLTGFPTTPTDLVMDIGAYHGEWALGMHEQCPSRILCYEPVGENFRTLQLATLFAPNVQCFNYGLGATTALADISVAENSSSFYLPGKIMERALIRSVHTVLQELRMPEVQVCKINIEGGEYALLDSLIDSGDIRLMHNVVVQFHDLVPDSRKRYAQIRAALLKTHDLLWEWPFIWEAYTRRT